MTSPLWPVAGFKAAAMESIHEGVVGLGNGRETGSAVCHLPETRERSIGLAKESV